LAGTLIDAFLSILIILPILSALDFFQSSIAGNQMVFTRQVIVTALSLIILTVLHGYLIYKNGQTIGKYVVGTKIVKLDGDKQSVGKILVLRYYLIALVTLIPIVGNLIGIIDSLFIFRNDHRCIHDHIAGTKVVNA
jgi:uncharacterized RDD family membrane protein YckC